MKRKMIALILLVILSITLSACDISTTVTSATTSSTTTTMTSSSSTETDTLLTTLTTTSGNTLTTTSTTTTTVDTTLQTFTSQQLAVYNGNGGSTAYIAVSGIVYDVTNASEWTNGWHKGVHYAGTDCTTAFASSPHSLSFLNQLTIVGTYVN